MMRVRYCDQSNLDIRKPVCIGMFRGDVLTHRVYGANDRGTAMREASRMRAQGLGVRLTWLNCGEWVYGLWVQDLARPLTRHPDKFYGALESPSVYKKAA